MVETTEVLELTGPMLRQQRLSAGLSLRKVAATAGMSHGHLSKVEAGERPVLPAVLRAYELALQVPVKPVPLPGRGPAHGQMNLPARRHYNSRVAAVAIGGDLDGHRKAPHRGRVGTVLEDATLPRPADNDHNIADELRDVAGQLLKIKGAATGYVAYAAVVWVARLLTDDEPRLSLLQAIARFAYRTAESALQMGYYQQARDLLLLAVYGATCADDYDLRADALLAISDQHMDFGYFRDAVRVLRLAETDERISDEVREKLLHLRSRAKGQAPAFLDHDRGRDETS